MFTLNSNSEQIFPRNSLSISRKALLQSIAHDEIFLVIVLTQKGERNEILSFAVLILTTD